MISTVQRDVAPPPPRQYPYAELRVGESFTVPWRSLHSVRTLVATWGRRQVPPRKFSVRKVNGDEWRCWRIA